MALPEGSRARPARLDHFQNIVEVGWGSAPIVVLQIDGVPGYYQERPTSAEGAIRRNADPPIAFGAVIPKSGYADVAEFNPRPLIGGLVAIGPVLDSTTYVYHIDHTLSYSNETHFTSYRRSVLFNFKNCEQGRVTVNGRRGDGRNYYTETDFDLTYRSNSTQVSIKATAYRSGAIFTLRADGSIASSGTSVWSFEAIVPLQVGLPTTPSMPATVGPITDLIFDKKGRVS